MGFVVDKTGTWVGFYPSTYACFANSYSSNWVTLVIIVFIIIIVVVVVVVMVK
jgi:hypothetical protein